MNVAIIVPAHSSTIQKSGRVRGQGSHVAELKLSGNPLANPSRNPTLSAVTGPAPQCFTSRGVERRADPRDRNSVASHAGRKKG